VGEIYNAYSTLNRVLNLGLTRDQIMAAEMQFKIDLAKKMKFPAQLTRNAATFSANWEMTATLTPRRRKLRTLTTKTLTQLKAGALKLMQSRLTQKVIRRPVARPPAATPVGRRRKV